MTPKKFKQEMERISKLYKGDQEAVHSHMDRLMCSTLRELGYDEGIDIFDAEPKWYA